MVPIIAVNNPKINKMEKTAFTKGRTRQTSFNQTKKNGAFATTEAK